MLPVRREFNAHAILELTNEVVVTRAAFGLGVVPEEAVVFGEAVADADGIWGVRRREATRECCGRRTEQRRLPHVCGPHFDPEKTSGGLIAMVLN